MKKILTVILCVSTVVAMQAQTSRLMMELGAFDSHSIKYDNLQCTFSPGGTFGLGYAIMEDVGYRSSTMLGLRTGVNCSYMRNTFSSKIISTFTNTAYSGDQLQYTVSSDVKYYQRQVNVEVPLMFAMTFSKISFNIGAKAMTTVWNSYEQRLDNPTIAALFPELGVTVVNNVSTGVVPADQMTMKGTLTLPRLTVGLTAELGLAWNIEDEHYIGFCLFADYMPWSFFGESDEAKKSSVIVVDPIVNDCEQPKANVTVNPLYQCEGFSMKQLSFGIKLQYWFSVGY